MEAIVEMPVTAVEVRATPVAAAVVAEAPKAVPIVVNIAIAASIRLFPSYNVNE